MFDDMSFDEIEQRLDELLDSPEFDETSRKFFGDLVKMMAVKRLVKILKMIGSYARMQKCSAIGVKKGNEHEENIQDFNC